MGNYQWTERKDRHADKRLECKEMVSGKECVMAKREVHGANKRTKFLSVAHLQYVVTGLSSNGSIRATLKAAAA